MKRQAEFDIIDQTNVNVKIKSSKKIPRDFKVTIERLAKLMGFADDTITPSYALDSIQLIQIDLYNVPAQFDTSIFNEVV